MRSLTLTLLLTLAACGEKSTDDDTAGPDSADDSAADDSSDDSAADDSGEVEVCPDGAKVTFEGADGSTMDLTQTLLSGDYTTLDSPGTLSVCPGTWYARLLLRADIDVIGLGQAPEDTVLSGGESGTILDISGEDVLVNVRNLTLDRGVGLDVDHNSGGGGLYCEAFATVVAEDLLFTNNFANDGSGLYAQDCDLLLRRNRYIGNTSEDDGGAVTLWFSTATIEEVRVEGNEGLDGGGMAFFYSEVEASQLVVADNQAGNFAGGIWVYDSTITLSDAEITGNQNPTNQGGGMIIYGTATLDSVRFADNVANEGGGIFVYYFADVTATDCDFSGNSPEDLWFADFSEAGGQALTLGEGADFQCAENACWTP